ncbi:MAG: methyltransferase domain-containing protein [bacterium]
MSSLDQVRKHFDRDAPRFDAIYERRKSWLDRFVDSFRSVVVRRFELVRALAPLPGRWQVLDVGCGTCRYGLALASLGAAKVVGIDVSGTMIELARSEIRRRGLETRFDLVVGDFLGWRSNERFEAVLAMGYFDYLRDPAPHLEKLKSLCSGRLFASLPKRWEWRVPMRRVRFLLSRSYVRFYSRGQVEDLLRRAGFEQERVHLVDMGRDWILVANCLS